MLIAKFALIYILISLGIIYLSRYLGYFDKPNKRGIHKIPIINTGGLIIYLVFLTLISHTELNHNIELIVSMGFFVCVTGFVDDRINLNPSNKILLIISTFKLLFSQNAFTFIIFFTIICPSRVNSLNSKKPSNS